MKKMKVLAACLLGLSAPTTLLAVEPFTIKDIRIEGLSRTEPATIFSYLSVKIGDQFTDTKGEQMIKDLYSTGFFDDIQVETLNQQVLLTVTERPIISTLTVSGGKTLSNKDIEKNLTQMGLASARVYDPVVMAQAIGGLRQEYINRGKNSVNIEQKVTPLERNRVAIELKIDEGKTTVIREIDFSGNEHFSDYRLRKQMKLSESGLFTWLTKSNRFSPEKFSNDLTGITEFYQDNGYFDFKIVSTDVVPNQEHPEDLDIKVDVNEGQRYRWGDVTLSGDTKEVAQSELQQLLLMKKGKWYDRSQMVNSITRIHDRMGEDGYALADIQIQPQPRDDAEEPTVDFVLNVLPGRKMYVNQIHIAGNNKTRDEVIRREMRQMESASYDGAKVRRSKERIELLGHFEEVDIQPQPVAGAPDQMDISVNVKERPTGSLDLRVGYAQGDGMVFSGGVSQDNLFGTGKSASLFLSNSKESKQAALSFTDPYFTTEGVSLGYDIFWRAYDPHKTDTTAYKTETYGLGTRLGVPITEYDRLNFGLSAENTKLTLYPQSPQRYHDFVNRYGRNNWTLKGNVGWGRNTTDSAIWPTRGYIISANAELGLPGGDIQYYKLTHSQKWFFPLSKSFTLMLGGDLGHARGYGKTKELPFFHNFYGGGLGSVRGYESGSVGPKSRDQFGNIDYLGGQNSANMTAEVLFPMPGMADSRAVRLSLFADAGSVWDGRTYTSADYQHYTTPHRSTFKNELRYSTGLAFTWLSPLGPMKFSYAYPMRKREGDKRQAFQFQLGTVF